MTCPLCNPDFASEEAILENRYCLFLMKGDQPVLPGSGIIIPKEHRETVFDLTSEEWNATFELLLQAKVLLDGRYHPQGYNIGWNAGVVGGQEIPHAHFHVIPRFGDEPYANRGIRYWLKQPGNKRPGC